MIRHIKGNLLERPNGINVLAHQANIENTMGAGIALGIKNKWPQAYEADRRAYMDSTNNLGSFSYAWIKEDSLIIINAYAQSLSYNSPAGFPTSYDSAAQVFRNIRRWLEKGALEGNRITIGLPKLMGCGLGGADWRVYEKIIESELDSDKYTIYIVEYNK